MDNGKAMVEPMSKKCEKCGQDVPETLEEKVARLERELEELRSRQPIIINNPPALPDYGQPWRRYEPQWPQYPIITYVSTTSTTRCDDATGGVAVPA